MWNGRKQALEDDELGEEDGKELSEDLYLRCIWSSMCGVGTGSFADTGMLWQYVGLEPFEQFGWSAVGEDINAGQ